MEKKRVLWSFLLVVLVFSLSPFVFASHATPGICLSPTDVIMRLSAGTNAHGELGSGVAYSHDICYSHITGSAYAGPLSGAALRTCGTHPSGANPFGVWLSASTNAHGATIPSGTYTQQVCYGDISCTTTTASSCSSGVSMAHLSSSTNAHLEDASFSGNYHPTTGLINGITVCCSVPVGGSLQWRDPSTGTEVTSIYLTNVGTNSVDLVYVGDSPPSDPDNFDVFEDDGATGDDTVFSDGVGTDTGSDYVHSWIPSASELSAAADSGTEGQTAGPAMQYYFTINGLQSPDLNIDFCGDNEVTDLEQCDDGNLVGGDGCSTVCTTEVPGICGDSVINVGEQCDDGNILPGDGCDDSCQIENNNDVYFTDLDDDRITQACVGEAVKAFFPDGAPYNTPPVGPQTFQFYENDDAANVDSYYDGSTLPFIPPYDDDLGTISGVVEGTNLIAVWGIEQSDYDVGEPGLWDYSYRFEVQHPDGTGHKAVKDADALTILPSTDPTCVDERPSGLVIDPPCGTVLEIADGTTQVTRDITFEAKDPNQEISWDLAITGPGASVTYRSSDVQFCGTSSCLGGSFTVPLHPFDRSGAHTIQLVVYSHEAGTGTIIDQALTIVQIAVVDRNAGSPARDIVLACIKEPTNQFVSTEEVIVSGEGTKVVQQLGGNQAPNEVSFDSGDIEYTWNYGMSTPITNPYAVDQSNPENWAHTVYYPEAGAHTLGLIARYNP